MDITGNHIYVGFLLVVLVRQVFLHRAYSVKKGSVSNMMRIATID